MQLISQGQRMAFPHNYADSATYCELSHDAPRVSKISLRQI